VTARGGGLRFRADGTFTILQLTDLHVSNLGEEDARTIALAARLIEAERPDLVVFTGDLISAADAADPARALRTAVSPAHARGLAWTAVLGNHDDEGALAREEVFEVLRGHPTFLGEPGPRDLPGVGNFVLRVASAARDDAALDLFFLDSGSYDPDDRSRYAWIRPEQIAWFRAAAGPAGPPALAFFHIPLPEYVDVWERGACRGNRLEPVCCPAVNSGFFGALRDARRVLATFVGHDHLNDYEGDLEGVRLCYGRATGHGSYGRDDFPRGARAIRLHEGARSFETWIAL
jgi:hypothetical protein